MTNFITEPQIDPERVDKLAPLLVVQLAKLTQAIMGRVREGDKFHDAVHIEMGNAVALLVRTVKPGDDNKVPQEALNHAGQRTTEGAAGDSASGAAGNDPAAAGPGAPGRLGGVAKPRSAQAGSRVRKGGKRPDAG